MFSNLSLPKFTSAPESSLKKAITSATGFSAVMATVLVLSVSVTLPISQFTTQILIERPGESGYWPVSSVDLTEGLENFQTRNSLILFALKRMGLKSFISIIRKICNFSFLFNAQARIFTMSTPSIRSIMLLLRAMPSILRSNGLEPTVKVFPGHLPGEACGEYVSVDYCIEMFLPNFYYPVEGIVGVNNLQCIQHYRDTNTKYFKNRFAQSWKLVMSCNVPGDPAQVSVKYTMAAVIKIGWTIDFIRDQQAQGLLHVVDLKHLSSSLKNIKFQPGVFLEPFV